MMPAGPRPVRIGAAALLLAATILAAPATTSQVGTPTSPFQVTEIAVTGPDPAWTVPAGGGLAAAQATDTTLRVTVQNTGAQASAGYTVRYFWEQGGARQDLNEDASTSFDNGGPLDPGESRPHDIEWRLQAGGEVPPRARQAGSGSLVIVVDGSGTREARKAVTVPIHDFRVEVIGGEQTIGLEGTAVWVVLLHNSGNTPEVFTASITPPNSRLDARLLGAEATVPAGSQSEARLRVHYPDAEVLDDFTHTYTVRLAAQGVTGTRSATAGPLRVVHEDPPPVTYAETLQGPTATVFVAPEAATSADFVLRNGGNVASAYTLTPSASGGWGEPAATIEGQPADEWALEAGESVTVRVSANAPAETPGHAGKLTLAATPLRQGAPPISVSVPLRVSGPAPVVQSISVSGAGPYVGDPVPVTVTVANLGDQPMQEGDVLTVVAEWAAGPLGTAHAEVPVLAPGDRAIVPVELPRAEAVGPVDLTASLDGGSPDPAAHLAATVRDAVISFQPPAPLDGLPAASVAYKIPPNTFFVRNNGDHAETILVSVLRGQATFDGSRSFLLQPGEGRQVPLSHVLPAQPGAARSVELTLVAAIQDAPSHFDQATAWTTVRDFVPPTAGFARTLPPEWKAGKPLDVQAEARDNTALAFAFVRVENATGVHDFPVNDTAGWDVELRLPTGSHTVTVHATDAHGNTAVSPEHVLDVATVVPPQILDPAVDNATSAQSFTARVLSPTPLDSLELIVDDGAPMVLDEEESLVNVSLELEPGNHTLLLVAIDEDGGRSEWEGTFTVDAAEAEPEEEDEPYKGRDTPAAGAVWLMVASLALAWRRRQG